MTELCQYFFSTLEFGGKQWRVFCIAIIVALATGVGFAVPMALRSSASADERLSAAENILTQVPLIDG